MATLEPWTSFAHQTSSSTSTSAAQGLSSFGEGPSVTAERIPIVKASSAGQAFGQGSFGPSHYSDLAIDARKLDQGRLDNNCTKPDQRLTASDVILRKRAIGTGNGQKLASVQFPEDSKVSEVLSQTVTFLSYEIDPILIAEFIQHRTKRNRKNCNDTAGFLGVTPSVSEEDVSRVLSKLVSDLNSEDYRSFCDLIRRIGYDLHVLDFLEALDDLLRLVTSSGSNQATPLLGRLSEGSSGCTCFLPSDDERISWNRTPSVENLVVDRHFEIRFLYADRESRAAQSFTEVERLKRRKRRKSRLPVAGDPVAVLGDTSDRYVPMMSVRLFNSCLCEVQMRRLGRILESHTCIRDLAVVETRFDTPAKLRLGHSLGQNLCLFQLDLRRSTLGNDGVMYLANALRRNDSIRILNLSQNGINGRGCALLVRALSINRTLAELDLGFNEVSDAGCRHLAVAIGTNSSLRHLRLPSNGVSSSGAVALFRALRRNWRLQGLDLSDNPIGDRSVDALSEVLIVNRTLREVVLNNCTISEAGCPSLARAFKANMKLRTVKVADNPLGDVGLMLVADGVKYNRALEELVFDACGITDIGLLGLLDATRHNATLKSVHLCRNSITLACHTSLASQPPYLLHCWASPVIGTDDAGPSRYGGGPLSAQEIYTILRQANPSLTIILKENGITKTVI